jgi:hypothetical protein
MIIEFFEAPTFDNGEANFAKATLLLAKQMLL